MRALFRKSVLIAAALAAAAALGADAQAQSGGRTITPEMQKAIAAAPKPQEMFQPMRDGVKLAANVYLPPGPGPFPTILSRTPYIKDNPLSGLSAKRYVDAGYAYVLQDTRGKGHSQGFYIAFATDIEDGYDTVEWIAQQPWSNGKIGIVGGSALGMTANAAAMAAPPHLVAAYVSVAYDDSKVNTYPGGVLKKNDTVGWERGQGMNVPERTGVTDATRTVFDDQRSMLVNYKYVKIPIYNVGGWYDIFSEGNVRNFVRLQNDGANGARGNQKLSMGPAGHGGLQGGLAYPQWDAAGQREQEMRWWDHWLKGADNGIMKEPPVTYFMMGAGEKGQPASPDVRVMHAANWPPASHKVRFYLTPAKALTTDAPSAAKAQKISYKFDPAHPVPTIGGANLLAPAGPKDQREIKPRPDYLRFETAPLDQPVAIAGNVTVELYGATDGLDTDFMAKLVDVYPDGYEAIVLDAPIRARYRRGFMADQVALMTPNKPDKMVIDLWDTAITFAKGHKIALHISSSSSPKYEINPNTGEAPSFTAKLKPRVATNAIYMDAAHPSALVLPVIENAKP
ncbi:MAG TPA: CocE/NonD family hydrolase [Caulobacterales bacterium]|jgi:predicted acyl esterase|nr:CocE/NonD family hydrolase [Caulobacterales bacterium]